MTHGQRDATPMVTFPAAGHHRPLTCTKLYCVVTRHVVNNLPKVITWKWNDRESNPQPFVTSQQPNHYIHRPPRRQSQSIECKTTQPVLLFSSLVLPLIHSQPNWRSRGRCSSYAGTNCLMIIKYLPNFFFSFVNLSQSSRFCDFPKTLYVRCLDLGNISYHIIQYETTHQWLQNYSH